MKSRLIIIGALKIFFIWVLLPFFSFVPAANAQNEARAFCKEKITGYKADPKTGAFLNPDHNAAARCPGGGNICFQINNCIAEYEFKNQNQSQQKTDVNKTKNPSSNETQNAEQYFKKDIDFTGMMECGPYIGKESTWGNYSTKLSGTLHNGKATIIKKWKEGIEDGENILSLVLDKNGKAEINGKEVISSTIGTFYKNYNFTGGVQNNGNILIASGKKYENGKVIRECKINLAFAKLPVDINSKNLNVIDAQKNKNQENAENKTIDNKAKEAETERLAALEIEKKRLKEEAEAKAKASEANRLAAIEAEKQKQRDAAEAKARADKAAKEAEIERLAALEIEKKRLKEEAEAKAKTAEANRLAAIEAEKQKQREAAEAKAKADKAAKDAEIERLAALEIEKQKQKEAVAARVAAIEAEKQKQREIAEAKEKLEREKEIERLAALEVEKKRIREEKETAIKAEAIRLAAIEAENKRQKEEAEAKARAQRVIELENELKKLKTDSSQSKPVVQQRQENIRTDNDPLTVFEGAWASVSPPVFYLIFTKVSLGARQVSLPNIGQANIRLSDGAHGSNFQISAPNLNCYYFVSFTSNRQKMIMELKAGDSLCLQSSILERTE